MIQHVTLISKWLISFYMFWLFSHPGGYPPILRCIKCFTLNCLLHLQLTIIITGCPVICHVLWCFTQYVFVSQKKLFSCNCFTSLYVTILLSFLFFTLQQLPHPLSLSHLYLFLLPNLLCITFICISSFSSLFLPPLYIKTVQISIASHLMINTVTLRATISSVSANIDHKHASNWSCFLV
jgi:hypothetical protein